MLVLAAGFGLLGADSGKLPVQGIHESFGVRIAPSVEHHRNRNGAEVVPLDRGSSRATIRPVYYAGVLLAVGLEIGAFVGLVPADLRPGFPLQGPGQSILERRLDMPMIAIAMVMQVINMSNRIARNQAKGQCRQSRQSWQHDFEYTRPHV